MTAKDDKDKSRTAHILLSTYEAEYKKRHKKKPILNRYSAKWGMLDVIDSVGGERARELIEYYFHTGSEHSIEFFYRNFDKLDVTLSQIREDRRRRAKILEETRKMVEEARNQ